MSDLPPSQKELTGVVGCGGFVPGFVPGSSYINNNGGGCNYETQQHYKTGMDKLHDFTFFGQTFKYDCTAVYVEICVADALTRDLAHMVKIKMAAPFEAKKHKFKSIELEEVKQGSSRALISAEERRKLSEQEIVLLENLHFAKEKKFQKILNKTISALKNHFFEKHEQEEKILNLLEQGLNSLSNYIVFHENPDRSINHGYLKLEEAWELISDKPKASPQEAAASAWRNPLMTTHKITFSKSEIEKTKANISKLPKEIKEKIFSIIQKNPIGRQSFVTHAKLATEFTCISQNIRSDDGGLTSKVFAYKGASPILINGFFENGLLKKLEIGPNLAEVKVLPEVIQQAAWNYFRQNCSKLKRESFAMKCYSSRPEWSEDGLRYRPSYHLVIFTEYQEMGTPLISQNKCWYEETVEYKEQGKNRAIEMKHLLETARHVITNLFEILGMSPRILCAARGPENTRLKLKALN
ncbi:hypothetical protein F0562_008292 [Nyssa sinensis]|uniref:Uncharacterized protein n=1 Tax=Nyssa sinensis TaxID=561372 RepID=A0A5J5A5W9_9ASTE|nr:hypothetical protein F0562_008292 [Nyssa sinensis]